MKHRNVLVSCGFGSIYSYELEGDYLIGRLFGHLTVTRIHLAAIHYLRLATPAELPSAFLLFHWTSFLPHRKITRPMYVIQTRRGYRVVLTLDADAHFRLRQAIGRYTLQNNRMAA